MALCALAILTLAADASAAKRRPPMQERILAERVVQWYERSPAIESLTAGFGFVAWVEVHQGTQQMERVAVMQAGRVRRGPWTTSGLWTSIVREIDRDSGSPVTLLYVGRCDGDSPCSGALVSPITLLPVPTDAVVAPPPEGPAESPAARTRDAGIAVASTVVRTDARPTPGGDTPSACLITVTGRSTTVPPIDDCTSPVAQLRGTLLMISGYAPSSTYDRDGTRRYWVFDLDRPDAGWRQVGSSSNYGKGVTRTCLLDDGVAVVDGWSRSYSPNESADWTLTFVPIRPGRPEWTIAAPRLAEVDQNYRDSGIACTGTSIYASYTARIRRGGREIVVSRIAEVTRRPGAAHVVRGPADSYARRVTSPPRQPGPERTFARSAPPQPRP